MTTAAKAKGAQPASAGEAEDLKKDHGVLYLGIDLGTSRTSVCASNGVRETVEPNPDWARLYEDGYARFRSLYPAIAGVEERG